MAEQDGGYRRDPNATMVVVGDQWWFLAPSRDTATQVERPTGDNLESLARAVASVDANADRDGAEDPGLRAAAALGLVEPAGDVRGDARCTEGGPFAEIERYRTLGRSVSFVDYADPAVFDDDRDRMTTYEAADPPPSPYKDYGCADPIRLPHPACMRSCNAPREHLGRLLFWPFGRVRAGTFLGQLSAQRKAVPSQGARHPLEAYVAVAGDAGPVAPGLYHYDPRRHALEPLPGEHRPAFDTGIRIYLTAVFERYQWRYRDRWVYKDLFFEVGHVFATLRMLADDLGLSVREVEPGASVQWPWLVEDCLAAYCISGWGAV